MKKSIVRLFTLGVLLSLAAGCASLPDADGTSLAAEVQTRIDSDGTTARQGIGVTEEFGVVTLSGPVRDIGIRARAVSIARGTPAVRGVVENFSR